jgi:hypothetical protein
MPLFILGLVILGWIYCYLHLTAKVKRKLNQIQSAVLIEVNSIGNYQLNLPLGKLGIPIEINEYRQINVVFPRLTSKGEIQYVSGWYELQAINVQPNLGNRLADDWSRLNVAQELFPLIKDHLLFVEPEILRLNAQWHELKRIYDLVSSSDIYAQQKDIYKQALLQIQNLLKKAKELEEIHIRTIREILIGREIARYDPELLPNSSSRLDFQYRQIKQEYQFMKDTAIAYMELLRRPL